MISDFQKAFASLADQCMQDEVVSAQRQNIDAILKKPIASIQEALDAIREIRTGLSGAPSAHPFIRDVRKLARTEWERLRGIEEARKEALPSTTAAGQKRGLEEVEEVLPMKKEREEENFAIALAVKTAEAESGSSVSLGLGESIEEEVSRYFEGAKRKIDNDVKRVFGNMSPHPILQTKIDVASQEALKKIEKDKLRIVDLVKRLEAELKDEPLLRSIFVVTGNMFYGADAETLGENIENMIALCLCLKGKDVSDEFLKPSDSVSVTLWRKHLRQEWKAIHDMHNHLQKMPSPCVKLIINDVIMSFASEIFWREGGAEKRPKDYLKQFLEEGGVEEREINSVIDLVDPFIKGLVEERAQLINKMPANILKIAGEYNGDVLAIAEELRELFQEGLSPHSDVIVGLSSDFGETPALGRQCLKEIIETVRQMKGKGIDIPTIKYMVKIAYENFDTDLVFGNAFKLLRSFSLDQIKMFMDFKSKRDADDAINGTLFNLVLKGVPWDLIDKLKLHPKCFSRGFLVDKDIQKLIMDMEVKQIDLFLTYFGDQAFSLDSVRKMLLAIEKIPEFLHRIAEPPGGELSEQERTYIALKLFKLVYGDDRKYYLLRLTDALGVSEPRAYELLVMFARRLTLDERQRLIDACFKDDPCLQQLSGDLADLKKFEINIGHLKTGCILKPIPPNVSNNYPLEGLYQLFDAIPWTDELLSKCYREGFELRSYAVVPQNAKEELRNKLHEFIEKIQKRTAYMGTPRPGPALEEFYGKIELCLRHCGAKLSEQHDNFATLGFIVEILRASSHCGGRIFQTAVNQYYLICHGIKESPREIFEQLLADYRRICFEGVVNQLYDADVHVLMQAIRGLGEELGIPGAKEVFEDIFIPLYNSKNVKKNFFEKAYTPHTIIFDHLIPTLDTDTMMRDAYIDLQKEMMPPTWNNDEKYAKIYRELEAIPHDVEDRVEAENAILKKYDVYKIGPEQSAAEAIEADRKSEYLATFVYDANGKRTLKGMLFLLEQMGVLKFKTPVLAPPKVHRTTWTQLFWSLLEPE